MLSRPNKTSLNVRKHHASVSPSRDLSLRRGLGEKPQEAYVYQPLPSQTSIRLIQWPDTLVPTADLRFSLKTIDLTRSDRPPFTTISYTWGADSGLEAEDVESLNDLFTNTVVCDGCYLRVTENAHTALSELQWRGRSSLFWMDAVCINQYDIEERNHQVAMMGDIYANAERTIVWLGEDDEPAYAAHQTIQDNDLRGYSSKASLTSHEWVREHLRLELKRSPASILRLQLIPRPPKDLMNLLALFSRPWFQRLWVIQEVVLAKKLWIFCGGLMFDWQAMVDIVNDVRLAEEIQNLERDAIVSKGTHGLFVTRMIAFLRGDYTSFQRMASSIFGPTKGPSEFSAIVGTLISLFDESLLSDSRDRIYAPLALAARICASSPSAQLLPDYAQSAEDVFTNAALYFIHQSQSLSIFSMHKTIEDRSPLMPSWVPDLRVRSGQKAISTLCTCEATKNWPDTPIFDSSLQNVSSHQLTDLTMKDHDEEITNRVQLFNSEDALRLRVAGVTTTTISKITECVSTLLEDEDFLPLLDLIRSSKKHGSRSSEMPFVLLQTLTFGSLRTANPLVTFQPVEYDFSAWFSFKLLGSCRRGGLSVKRAAARMSAPQSAVDRFLPAKLFAKLPTVSYYGTGAEFDLSLSTLVRQATEIDNLISTSSSNSKAFDKLAAFWDRAYRFESACRPYVKDRSIFLTSQGEIGMCPRTSRCDDQIWFLQGARTPVVLRPLDSGDYEFVGEAYLRSHMQGEICSKYKSDELQTIFLR